MDDVTAKKRVISEKPTDAVEAPVQPRKEGEKTFKLRKSIEAHGDEISELMLREPTAKDIMKAGYPVVMRPLSGGGIQLVPDEQKMTAMIVELAAIPPSSVGKMHPRDWATISAWLAGFFGPDWDQVMS